MVLFVKVLEFGFVNIWEIIPRFLINTSISDKTMTILLLLGIFFLDGTLGQMRSTWPPWAHPGEECLTYDGSRVPDCRQFIDPEIKEPYYHPHNTSKKNILLTSELALVFRLQQILGVWTKLRGLSV